MEDSSDDKPWTEREREFITALSERIDSSDFNGDDTDAAVAQVRSYWEHNIDKPIPDWLLTNVQRRVRNRDFEARLKVNV